MNAEDAMLTFKPKKILVPTDFSELATWALRYGAELADHFSATLSVIYVDRFGPAEYLEISPDYYDDLPAMKRKAEEALSNYLTTQLPVMLKRESGVVIDFPVPGILKTVEGSGVDLVVMGTHGRSGWRRALLGSITEGVLRGMDRPVLTVRHSEGDETPAEFKFHRVLCPVNFTDVAHAALDHAASIACAFDAQLVVAHVVESPDQVVQKGDLLDHLREWIPSEIRDRCDYKELVLKGNAAEQVIEFGRTMNVDLIAIGAQHQRFSDTTVIGTTTERITRHAYCPVLTVSRRVAEEKSVGKSREGKFMEPVGLII